MRLPAVAFALSLTGAAICATAPTPTFNKEVLPILEQRCQECHRSGEAVPFTMMSYQEARPWAKSIKQAVLTKKMPPWFADPHYGKFSNDRSLTQHEIDILVAWVDAGAPEGNPKDAPAPRQFVEGWTIGKPDMVIEMPNAFPVSAQGVIEYQYVILPTNLKEDRWVVAAEVRPGDKSVMHHVITSIREPNSKWNADMEPGKVFVPAAGARAGLALSGGLVGYVPGQALPSAETPHRATLLKAGSDIVFQLHYTPNGKATSDKTKIGLIFAKEPPKYQVIGGNSASYSFSIPAGDPEYQVVGTSTLSYDCDLISMMPHAHLRGKSFEYRITHPSGEVETVLSVPKYDFNWQLTYYLAKPMHLLKGTKVEVIAKFDNSATNPYNPDPLKIVHWGEQTFQEMMMGYYAVVVDADKAPAAARRGAAGAGSER
jgi:hypothetical protein